MSIVENKKAYHDYFVEEKFEAGVALEGWEVKAIRAGRAQLKEAYVVVKSGEIVLLGAHITPLATASNTVLAAFLAAQTASRTTIGCSRPAGPIGRSRPRRRVSS